MLTRELIDTAHVPGGEELRLYRHGRDFIIALDRNELMSTRMRFSEEQLAELTLARVDADRPRVLIGGYGMGFTLRAALARCGPNARIDVAELVPEIVDWAHGPMAELTGDSLHDRRVDLRIVDVGKAIAAAERRYDAILLDVDNGPDGLVRAANDALYGSAGLAAAHSALKSGGVLAIWSAAPDGRFTRQLERARFAVEVVTVRARPGNKGPRHTIWFARRA